MIFAELQGKLGSDYSKAHERSEDLLTSTAFGLLRYFRLESGLLALLKRTHRIHQNLQGELLAESGMDWSGMDAVSDFDIAFWPYRWEYGEPDLLLTLSGSDGTPLWCVLIEVKLYSPKSGRASEEYEVDPDSSEADPNPDSPDPDQLVRYWQLLQQELVVKKGAMPFLIYLTQHSTPPMAELAESLKRDPSMKLGWLSWRDVWRVANAAREDCLPAQDLARLLAHKGFSRFDGFEAQAWEPPIQQTFWNASHWFANLPTWIPPTQQSFWTGDSHE